MSHLHVMQPICFCCLLFKKTAIPHALLRGLITELAFSGSQASGLCAHPVLLFLHATYYEPEVCTGVALSEIRGREMSARRCGGVCVPIHTWACVGNCVYLQCYYSSLTEFTLSSKSAGWCNKSVYMCVGGCVYVKKTLCLHMLCYAD